MAEQKKELDRDDPMIAFILTRKNETVVLSNDDAGRADPIQNAKLAAWIDAALTSARPQAVGALLRYFRNLDAAEEAYQNACLRALKSWPQNCGKLGKHIEPSTPLAFMSSMRAWTS